MFRSDQILQKLREVNEDFNYIKANLKRTSQDDLVYVFLKLFENITFLMISLIRSHGFKKIIDYQDLIRKMIIIGLEEKFHNAYKSILNLRNSVLKQPEYRNNIIQY